MKNTRWILTGFFVTIFLSLGVLGTALADETEEGASRLDAYTKLRKVIGTVEQYYVDELKIQEIINKSIDGLLSNLDAHSSFLTTKKFKELKIQTEGEFGGLGITVGMKDGALTVVSPIEGTPADRAGLESGDIILKIGEQSTLNMTIDEAIGLMRGKPKTEIVLTIVRKDEPKPFDVQIIRDIIQVPSVYTKKIVDENLLYVRITNFDKHVVDKIEEAIQNSSWAQGIVLDLRNNPGGLLDQAVGVVDLFVDNGVIVSQKGRSSGEDRVFNASSDTATKLPLVVLVNNGSASASEIVSGALQDHKKAIVVGEKTFGKGSVQVIMPIDETEALRLTIARYYLPSGRTIQAVGVTPDLVVYPGKVPQEQDQFQIKESELKQHLEGELEKIDGDQNQSSTETIMPEAEDDDSDTITQEKVMNDIQLKTAIDIVKAWKIIKP